MIVAKSYLVLQLLGLAAWPWLLILIRRRSDGEGFAAPDLAFPIAKSLGLILVAYATWLLSFGPVPFSGVVAWLLWAATGGLGWTVAGTRPRQAYTLVSERWREILAAEAVFLAVFLSFCSIRAKTPDASFHYDLGRRVYDASGSEKFTNLAILEGIHSERHMPPRDSWLAGYALNYYYFGQFQWAAFCKMAGIPPRVGFNIGQAALFALIAANAFSLGLLLTRRIGAGLLAAYAIPIMGSPYGFIQLLIQGMDRFQFWEASRIVEGTWVGGNLAGPITEFPFFTFILGDFHAHGQSFHSLLLTMAIALLCPLGGRRKARIPRAGWFGIAVLGLLVGVTAMTNAWDTPSVGLLVLAIIFVRLMVARGLSVRVYLRAVLLSVIVAAIALLFLLPHLMNFKAPVGANKVEGALYIGPVKWLGLTHLSEFKDYMVHFGFLLVPIVVGIHAQLIGHIRQMAGRGRMLWVNSVGFVYLASLFVLLFAQRFFLLFFLFAMIGFAKALALLEIRSTPESEPAKQAQFAWTVVAGLSALGLFLSLFAELFVIEDGYEGAFERYNTVFKLYNFVWLVYGIGFAAVAGLVLPRAFGQIREWLRPRAILPLAGIGAILLMGAAYPIAATHARCADYRNRVRRGQRAALPPGSTFDAVRYYASVDRAEYALIEWVRENIEGRPVVAEGCAREDAYTLQGRLATFTGVRTVLAWPKHEANWRSTVPPRDGGDNPIPIWVELARRIRDLGLLYTSADANAIRRIVDRYKIEYILISRWERNLYGPGAGATLRKLYSPAFDRRGTTLLQVNHRDE